MTGGISDLMLNMGMRSVPLGDNECYSFNFYQNTWSALPSIPIGKLHPTLVSLGGRFIFQIGGFDDDNFDIYRLDMQCPNRPWKVLSLDRTEPIIDEAL